MKNILKFIYNLIVNLKFGIIYITDCFQFRFPYISLSLKDTSHTDRLITNISVGTISEIILMREPNRIRLKIQILGFGIDATIKR